MCIVLLDKTLINNTNETHTLSNQNSSGFKLKLKGNIIGYNGKPIYNSNELPLLKQQYPKLTADKIMEKCSTFHLGDQLASILMQVAGDPEITTDTVEKLKLFRWASKISSKLETEKGELEIDLKQAEDLFNYVGKVTKMDIILVGPILSLLDDIKTKLSKSDLK